HVHARRHDRVPRETTKSTLGDLIAALTEEAQCYVRDEAEVYEIVAYMVNDLLSRRRCLSGTWH
ncbi:MAG: hypothetical protein ACREQP_05705, partial [Candidatus Binatia bacterium]